SIDDDSPIDVEKNFGLLDEKAQLFRNILAEDKLMELKGKNHQQTIIKSASDTISNSFLLGNAFLGISSIVIITVISLSITRQLSSLKEVTRKLSLGNYNVEIPSLDDEFEPLRLDIGILAKTVNKNISELQNFKNALDKSASVAITDSDGIITYANDAFCTLTKYSKDEIIGKTHNLLKSGHHESEFYEDLWNTITSGKVWIGEIKNKTKNGAYNWGRTMIMPILDDQNKIIKYIEIRTDITSQIELREKLLKNEKLVTIGELSARLAHDIRNPLSIIQVSLENLKLMAEGKDIDKKHFDRVERAISRISHQIEDVLSFIRKEPMRFEKSHISEIIADALDSINLPDNIYFEISKNDFEFHCDKKRLPVALTNLILNSIQAISGKGTIKIDCEENDGDIVITIEDSGKGIPTNMIEDIFEPLFTTKQQGTGLGLASVKSIIQGHGGTISVTSPPTVFTIIMPKNPHL
ncbi:MAG: nitrogen regulation protein NR(II), partial [Nitrosopumilus sp.]